MAKKFFKNTIIDTTFSAVGDFPGSRFLSINGDSVTAEYTSSYKNYAYAYLPPVFLTEGSSYKEITGAYLNIYIESESERTEIVRCYNILNEWKFDDVNTFSQLPAIASSYRVFPYANTIPGWTNIFLSVEQYEKVSKTGLCLYVSGKTVQLLGDDYGAYLSFVEGETIGLNVSTLYPTGNATVSKASSNTFQWKTTPKSENTLTPVALKSCKFRWRYTGEMQYTEISLGAVNEYTVPAGTFESGMIEWQIAVTANSGTVTQSNWTQVSVSEPISLSKTTSPKNTIVDGTMSIEFEWEHVISNGTAQTGFDLQISRDLQQWDNLLSETTAANNATLPAGTFTAGDLYWRVRTYNLDNVAGAWSDPAHIIVVAAPAVPAITVVSSDPRFSVRWHQTEQQGYELSINGTVVAKKYGASSEYMHNKYLAPGTYDVRVRIQNKYGYWSGWGECILTVADYGEDMISLDAKTDGNIVQLSWFAQNEYDRYIVYRNGIKIGETTEQSFVDQFAAGETEYIVRGIFKDSGKCQVSEKITVYVPVESLMIAERSKPNWIMLPQSTSSLRSTTATKSCSVTYSYFAGSSLPDADIGEYQSKIYTLDCAWANNNLRDANAFESLLGKAVVVKTPTGKAFAAVLESLQPEVNRFWTSYTAQLTEIDTEDETI